MPRGSTPYLELGFQGRAALDLVGHMEGASLHVRAGPHLPYRREERRAAADRHPGERGCAASAPLRRTRTRFAPGASRRCGRPPRRPARRPSCEAICRPGTQRCESRRCQTLSAISSRPTLSCAKTSICWSSDPLSRPLRAATSRRPRATPWPYRACARTRHRSRCSTISVCPPLSPCSSSSWLCTRGILDCSRPAPVSRETMINAP